MRIAWADQTDPVSLVPHGASLGAIAAAFMGWLPGFVALVPAVYYIILIFESKTVQRFFKRRRLRKLAKRLHAKRHRT